MPKILYSVNANSLCDAVAKRFMSFEEVATTAGISKSTMTGLVSKKNPRKTTARTVLALAKALEVDTNTLLIKPRAT